jgi:PKHD-type hydroxylase
MITVRKVNQCPTVLYSSAYAMMLEIPDLLDAPMLSAVQDIASQQMFAEGKATAGWHARSRKNNLQAQRGGLIDGLLKKVEQTVMQHELVQAAGQPRNLVDILLSRYEEGMFYGSHVDNALMHGQRTDLSFTLFISEPDTYEGGELVVDETAGERYVKLEAGSLFLYPSSSLHRVQTVTRGTRLAIVGWLRSYVRDPHQREILFDLERTIAALRNTKPVNDPALDLLLKSRSNLLRLWAEC